MHIENWHKCLPTQKCAKESEERKSDKAKKSLNRIFSKTRRLYSVFLEPSLYTIFTLLFIMESIEIALVNALKDDKYMAVLKHKWP